MPFTQFCLPPSLPPSPAFVFRPKKKKKVVRMLGNGRAECYCYDGVTRLGHIRGKMRKKVWVSAGDIVLVGKRDYQDDKARELD